MVENSERVIHFYEYFRVVRNRLWVIFTIFILTVLSGAYVTEEVLPKEYTSSAQIQLSPRGEHTIDSFEAGTADKPFDSTAFNAEFEIMQSPDVLLPIINDLQLDKIWAKRVFKSGLDRLPPLNS